MSPRIESGAHENSCVDLQCDPTPCAFVECARCTFHVALPLPPPAWIALGIFPASQVARRGGAYGIAHRLGVTGNFYSPNLITDLGTPYGDGDEVTVLVDLDANTIAFEKNGASIGQPRAIPHDEYHFCVDTAYAGPAATIVG